MPLTLPTHPVAVVPLKLWRPQWFDGVALVLGAIAPDVPFAADGYGLIVHGHAWHAPLWWALPIVLIGGRLVRWAAPTVAAHLPAVLGLRDFGVLGTVRHPWRVTAVSAILGAVSHIAWDAFTHPVVDGPRVLFPALHRVAPTGRPWWDLLSAVSDLIGFVAGAVLVVHIGHHRLLRRWHGLPPFVPARPALFWPVVAVTLGLGLATLPFQPAQSLPSQAIRTTLIAGIALLVGTAAVRLRTPAEAQLP